MAAESPNSQPKPRARTPGTRPKGNGPAANRPGGRQNLSKLDPEFREDNAGADLPVLRRYADGTEVASTEVNAHVEAGGNSHRKLYDDLASAVLSKVGVKPDTAEGMILTIEAHRYIGPSQYMIADVNALGEESPSIELASLMRDGLLHTVAGIRETKHGKDILAATPLPGILPTMVGLSKPQQIEHSGEVTIMTDAERRRRLAELQEVGEKRLLSAASTNTTGVLL